MLARRRRPFPQLLFAAILAAPVVGSASGSALIENARITLIGFSPDESAYAYRLYSLVPEENRDPDEPFCKGYVDDGGKPFAGSMTIVIVDDGGALVRPIFDEGKECTPFEVAKKRLTEVKELLAARQIDPKKKAGTEVRHNGRGKKDRLAWPGCGTLEFEDRKVVKTIPAHPDGGEGETAFFKGNVEVFLRTEAGRTRQFDPAISAQQSTVMSGWLGWTMPLAFVSPSQKAAVVFVEEDHGSMRGGASLFFRSDILRCPDTPAKVSTKP